MRRGKDKNGKPEEESKNLWDAVTKDVKPLPGKRPPAVSGAVEPVAVRPPKKSCTPPTIVQKPDARAPIPAGPQQLDGRTDARLRKGKINVDARLDLHGHTQASAQAILEQFVKTAHQRGYRCILVITGKGRAGGGILREKLPVWLSLSPLNTLIIKHVSAAPKDGGTGAFYLYLKRERATK